MRITIEIRNRNPHTDYPNKGHIQQNIDALRRAIYRNPPTEEDDQLLMDTLSILEGIQRELPDG